VLGSAAVGSALFLRTRRKLRKRKKRRAKSKRR
jgi:hypothetical protein